MRIGIDIRAIGRQRTGDETYTRELVKHLLKIDRKNQYVLYTNTDDPLEIQSIKDKLEFDEANTQAEIVPILPASKTVWTFWVLPRYLREHPVDVLHVQYITPLVLPKQIALVTTIHDISFQIFPQHIKRSDLMFLKTLIPLSLRRADKIIGVSEFTRKELLKYYRIPELKVIGINNGVEEEFFEPLPVEALKEVKEKYQLPDRFIFYVGTHQPRKNLPFLIRSFQQLKEQHQGELEIDSLHLVIGGTRYGHNYDQGIDEALKYLTICGRPWQEYIHFPGYISKEDLPACYRNATLFCFPSMYEGFGIPVLESMACGVPVVCSDSSCLPEVAGEAAIIYQADHEQAFVEALYTGLVDQIRREQLVAKGAEWARQFSWEETAKKTLQVFESAKKEQ